MRQAGFLAAAGLVALDEMVDPIGRRSARARILARTLRDDVSRGRVRPSTCRTNIVAFDHPQARQLVEELAILGVDGGTVGPRRARFVTHAGVGDDDVTFRR